MTSSVHWICQHKKSEKLNTVLGLENVCPPIHCWQDKTFPEGSYAHRYTTNAVLDKAFPEVSLTIGVKICAYTFIRGVRLRR